MTNETKHTPGKWYIHERYPNSYAIIADDADGVRTNIAWLGQSADKSYDENLANARLISKAPELLEALEMLVSRECAGCEIGKKHKFNVEICSQIDCFTFERKQLIARVKGGNE